MSAICGWFETPVGGDPAAVAHAMAQELPGGATPQVAVLTPRTALIVSGADSWVSADGIQAAAVDGVPDFTSDELRALATQAGPARALFAAYERHGTDLARALRGAFAFMLLDGRTG